MSTESLSPDRRLRLSGWALLVSLSLGAAALAVLPSSPALPLALAAVALTTYGLYRFPVAGLTALLVLLAFYMWLDAVVFRLLPQTVEVLVSVGKEAVLAALLLVALLRRGRRAALAPAGTWWVLAALVALVAALAVVPAAPIAASLLEARFHLEYMLLMPIALLLAHREPDRKRVVWAVVLLTAAVAAGWLSVLGWVGLGGLDYAYASTSLLLGEEGGPFDAINALGSHFAIVLLLIGGLVLHAGRGRTRTVLLVLAAFFAWALLSTFSRRAVLGVGVGAVVIAVVARQWRLLGWVSVATLLMLLVVSPALLQRFSIAQADATGGVSMRLEHVYYTLEHLDPVSLFIGHGIGTAGVVPVVAGVRGAVDLHNYYLLLLYESGLVGLGLYLALCWLAYRGLVDRYRRGDSPFDRGVALGTIGALAGFLVMGLFGVGNATLPVAPLMWALLGVGLAAPPAPAMASWRAVQTGRSGLAGAGRLE